MRAVKIGELKNHLSKYLRLVRSGETIRVLDRNEPVAELRPAEPTVEEVFDKLAREGRCKPPTRPLAAWRGLPPLKLKRPFTEQDVLDDIRALDGE